MTHQTITQSALSSLGVDDLVGLHQQRSPEELRGQMAAVLGRLAPNASTVVRLAKADAWRSIELARGPGCAVSEGDLLREEPEAHPDDTAFPLRFSGTELGELVVTGTVDEPLVAELETLVSHYVVALVNLTLNADALQSSTQYYAGLQAFEEGVGLFKEAQPAAIAARFLNLVHSVLGTSFGALFLLEEHGDASSQLRLETALGIPEPMLEELCFPDGSWWPPTTLEVAPLAIARGSDGELDGLDNQRVPEVLSSVVTCPMSFEGVVVGVALAFNCETKGSSFAAKLDSLKSLGTLGAASTLR